MVCYFFFFKQKTAYEMRISDWSSDVCSSDLPGGKVATAPKTLHWRGKSFDGPGGQWPNPGDGLQAPRRVSFSRQRLDLCGSGIDAARLLRDLFQQIPAFLEHFTVQVAVRFFHDCWKGVVLGKGGV